MWSIYKSSYICLLRSESHVAQAYLQLRVEDELEFLILLLSPPKYMYLYSLFVFNLPIKTVGIWDRAQLSASLRTPENNPYRL